jgi:hypothetical protein
MATAINMVKLWVTKRFAQTAGTVKRGFRIMKAVQVGRPSPVHSLIQPNPSRMNTGKLAGAGF